VASALAMGLLYHPGFDSTRVYDGTDTRAFGLLIGAALAFVWPSQRLSGRVSRAAAWGIDAFGLIALVLIVVLIHDTDEYDAFLYRGGLVLLSMASAMLVASLVHPAGRLGRVLGVGPLRWIGVRSYGIYLWHYPIIVLTSPAHPGAPQLWRAGLQVTATVVVAALSWRFVEDPIRRGALERWVRARGWRRWRRWSRGWRPAIVLFGVGILVTSCVGMSQSRPSAGHHDPVASSPISIVVSTPPPGPSSRSSPAPPRGTPTTRAAGDPPAGTPATTTSCRSVVHIGDSTSEGLVSADYLPDRDQRISAQYARVGVTSQRLEISGGTSIVETVSPDQPNAYDVARTIVHVGYAAPSGGGQACWVLALGTNDTADVYVGSNTDRAARIAKMMALIPADQPVMWLTVRSLLPSGPYSEHNMRLWNQALTDACSKYPNMRIYDWASVVQKSWFIDDGIHFTTPGYANRARDIAQALVRAEPASGPPSTGCVVH
jgi:lysophospholipase L1-like esterase